MSSRQHHPSSASCDVSGRVLDANHDLRTAQSSFLRREMRARHVHSVRIRPTQNLVAFLSQTNLLQASLPLCRFATCSLPTRLCPHRNWRNYLRAPLKVSRTLISLPLLPAAATRFVTIEVDGDSEENQNPKARPEDG